MGIQFEWTIKFGDVLTLFGALYVGCSFLYKRGGYDIQTKMILEHMSAEITELKKEMSEFGRALIQIGQQETKIGLLMKWYDELRRGVGKIED